MSDPRTPEDSGIEPLPPARPTDGSPVDGADRSHQPVASAADAADSPTQAWRSPATARDDADKGRVPSAAAASELRTRSTTGVSSSPYEPAPSLPPTRVDTVGDGSTAEMAVASRRGRPGAKWALAIIGIVIVAIASFAIVSLVR